MTAYVTNYAEISEKEAFQKELKANKEYGWLRDIPEPSDPKNDSPEAHNRHLFEHEEFVKDNGSLSQWTMKKKFELYFPY